MDIDGQDAFSTVLDRLEDHVAQRFHQNRRADEAVMECRVLQDKNKRLEEENSQLRSEVSRLRAQLPAPETKPDDGGHPF